MNILDLLLDAVCVVSEDGVFLSARGAVKPIFGYSADEMIGRQMIDLVHPDDVERTLHAVERLMQGHLQYDFENRYIRKDGRVVYLMWTARWYPEQGIRVAVARDIGTRHQQGQAFAPGGLPLSLNEALSLQRWRLRDMPATLEAPNGRQVRLSAQDYKVLQSIVVPRRVVTRREIIENLGFDFLDYDQRRLDTQMRRLRRRVHEQCGLTLPITTLRSVGFRFHAEIDLDSPDRA